MQIFDAEGPGGKGSGQINSLSRWNTISQFNFKMNFISSYVKSNAHFTFKFYNALDCSVCNMYCNLSLLINVKCIM